MNTGWTLAGPKTWTKAMLILNVDGVNKRQYTFSSIEQSTAFKRELNNYKILQAGFADLNAHLIDSYLVNQHKKTNGFKYAGLNLAWVVSKVFKKKLHNTKSNILLAPAEPDKDRSIGLYNPILPQLENKKYDLLSVNQLFSSIDLSVFFKWVTQIPSVTGDVRKALKHDASGILKEIKWAIFTDSLIHSLWLIQLRKFFKASVYRSVLVDWDRHKLQSLVVLAAKMEGIETFTFVHGAIYTPEKFVPLIAGKCLVWGNRHVEFFTAMGEDKNSLIKAGNTRFSKELPERQSILSKYKISADKKIILHPSQNFPDLEDHVIIKDLSRFISGNENFLLVVKTHPSQNNAVLKDKVRGLTNVILLDPSVTAKEALAVAEFTIIVSSTFSIDALIAGVPVAIYKAGLELRGIAVDLVGKGNVPLLESEKDFSELMDAVEKSPPAICFDMQSQQNFINGYCELYGDESAALISGLL